MLVNFTAILKGICVTLNLRIQALILYIYWYIDIYLEYVILALLWGARKWWKLKACKKYQLYSNTYVQFTVLFLEFVLNPVGKSYVCILHEYVQHALRVQPKYIIKETGRNSKEISLIQSNNFK